MKTFNAGKATVHVLKLADLRFRLADELKVDERDWRSKYGNLFEQATLIPSNAIYIKYLDLSIIVDPNDFSVSCPPDSEYFPYPDYKAPPDLLSQLTGISVRPEEINHVVITHAHHDHFAGVTRLKGGKYAPTFPNAKYYLGAGDWESDEMKESLRNGGSYASKTFGVLRDYKMLEIVNGSLSLNNFVRILPFPGESPGHQILEVVAQDRSFYMVGDLFHHWVEIEELGWNPTWADARQNSASRKSLVELVLSKESIVIPAHMNPGRIRRKEGSSTEHHWEEIQQ